MKKEQLFQEWQLQCQFYSDGRQQKGTQSEMFE